MGMFGKAAGARDPCPDGSANPSVWGCSSNPKQIPGNVGLGIVLLCQQREQGTPPPPIPQIPALALPPALLSPLLSPFGKARNKNAMSNAIPCVALRACCRVELQSHRRRRRRRRQLQPCPSPARSGRCPSPAREDIWEAAVLGIFLYIFIDD